MKNLKKPARLPRKAPSNQTGGTAWGKKLAAEFSRMVQSADMKKLILLNFPYIIAFYMVEKAAWLYRHCNGDSVVDRLMVLFMNFGLAYKSVLPSFHPFDLMVGLVGAAALKAVIYFKGKNAKKYRQGEEYGSARWGNQKDIEPFIDPVFENNVILTQTERLMMSGRPKHPKYARNKNVIVIGGSGSGKTRFYVKPNLMQMPQKVSYVVTDPKGTIIVECGKMLSDAGYKIKVLNTINFKKSMRYNPFHYIRSEKDILKLVNTIIANTKGDGEKSGEDFWIKAERLLYCALIGYIWYEAPEEEQNFSTLLEFINASEAREDDENFKNAVDELFEELEKDKSEHFAVRQYKKYKLAAGKTAKSILISCGARLAPFDIAELRDLMAYDEMELDLLGDRRTALFVIISDTDDTFNFVVSIMYTQLFNLLCDRADLQECEKCSNIFQKLKTECVVDTKENAESIQSSVMGKMAHSWKRSLLRSFIIGIVITTIVLTAIFGTYYALFIRQNSMVSPEQISISAYSLTDEQITFRLELLDGYCGGTIKTYTDENRNLYISVLRTVIKEELSDGETEIMNYGFNHEKKDYIAVYYGTPNNCELIWKKGDLLPTAPKDIFE